MEMGRRGCGEWRWEGEGVVSGDGKVRRRGIKITKGG